MPWDTSTRVLPRGWKATRERIGKRDHWLCQWPMSNGICGAAANQCDHKISDKQGGTDADDNLWMLCPYHHGQKSSAEGAAARRPRRTMRREPEPHPGAYSDRRL